MKIKIGDSLWHPCNMDIVEHKVTGINRYQIEIKGEPVLRTQYTTKAVHNVGACGRVEVIVSENNGKLRFVELVDEDDIEYASGLQDFIEGNYYTDENEAKLEFCEQQRVLTWSSMERQKRLYDQSKANYERVKKLVSTIKELIK